MLHLDIYVNEYVIETALRRAMFIAAVPGAAARLGIVHFIQIETFPLVADRSLAAVAGELKA
jgi:hypothetical protein